jgi:hypothetical protein
MRIALSLFALVVVSHALAQDVCSNLQVQVLVHPVETNLIVVRCENPDAEPINYPSWKIKQGETLVAEGETFFFQLPGVSHQVMEALITIEEGQTYAFELELYESFGSTLVCTIPFSGVVYNPDFCIAGQLTFYPVDNINQEVEIKMVDEFNTVLVNENIFFSELTLPVAIELCLDRACYQLSVEAVGSTLEANGLLTYWSDDLAWYSVIVPASENVSLFELDFYEGCANVSVAEHESDAQPLFPTVARTSELLAPFEAFAEMATLELFDIQGKRCAFEQGHAIKMPDQAGIYILHFSANNGVRGRQKVVVKG